jgi:ribosomal protein S19
MSRSIWKNNWLSVTKKNLKFDIKRNSCIPGNLVGKRVKVYNGKEFKTFIITREKVGFKFGQFCLTRSRISHSVKKIKKK